MIANSFIDVTFTWEGIHCWPDAPEEVYFLRTPHRHLFKAKVELEVRHDNREVEFILLKRGLEYHFGTTGVELEMGTTSCEMAAERIIRYLCRNYGGDRQYKVHVSEDGESGASVEWCP